MAMSYNDLLARIKAAFPDAVVKIDDLRGDGDHYALYIEDVCFQGLSRVAQHQLVYKALGSDMGTTLHALALTTKATA